MGGLIWYSERRSTKKNEYLSAGWGIEITIGPKIARCIDSTRYTPEVKKKYNNIKNIYIYI